VLERGPDDHVTPGGPYATMYGSLRAIQSELIRLSEIPTGANQWDELLRAVHALDAGAPEVRIGHCRIIRTD